MLNDVIKDVKKNTTKLASTVLNSLEEPEKTTKKSQAKKPRKKSQKN